MSRGFSKGLLHGTVISLVGLIGLMLAYPEHGTQAPIVTEADAPQISAQPNPGTDSPGRSGGVDVRSDNITPRAQLESVPEVESVTEVEPAPNAEPVTDAALTATQAAPDGPAASDIGLPEGSEFGRGGDIAPRLPSAIVPQGYGVAIEPSSVSIPAAEPSPVSIRDDAVRPELDLTGPASISSTAGESAATLRFVQPAPPSATARPQLPDFMPVEETDQPPQTGEPAAGTVADIHAAVHAADQNPASQPRAAAAPELVRPGVDLSLPPDLSDLKIMQRE